MSTPTAVFPGAIATDQQLKVANNLTQTSLAVGATSSNTILFVSSSAGFPSNCIVSVDKEIIAIDSVTGGPNPSLIVNPAGRGFDGTVAAAHSQGAKVSLYIDAWHHNVLSKEVQAIETFLGANGQNVNPVPFLISNTFQFSPQTPGGSLIVGSNSITLSPVPKGVNGTDQYHYLYISGGTGAAEAVLISGGTAVSGGTSGTVIVNCANAHSGSWTIQSASAGIQESLIVANQASPGGSSVMVPGGLWTIYAPITMPSATTLFGRGAHLQMAAGFWKYFENAGMLGSSATSYHDITVDGLEIDGNLAGNGGVTSPGVLALLAFGGTTSTRVVIRNCYIHDYPGNGATPMGGAPIGWTCSADGGGNAFLNNTIMGNNNGGGFFSTIGALVAGNIMMGTYTDSCLTFNSAHCVGGIMANNILPFQISIEVGATKSLVIGNSIIGPAPPMILHYDLPGSVCEDTVVANNICIVTTASTVQPLFIFNGSVSPQNITITNNIFRPAPGGRIINFPATIPIGWNVTPAPFGPYSKGNIQVVNGANENVAFPSLLTAGSYGTYMLEFLGASGAFSLGGLQSPYPQPDPNTAAQTVLFVANGLPGPFTLEHQSPASAAGTRFWISSLANTVCHTFTAVYDGTNWIVVGYS